MGANSQLLKVPAAGLDIAVMVNRHDLSSEELANKILDACISDLDPNVDAPNRQFPSGSFQSAKSGRVIQLLRVKDQPTVSIDGWDLPYQVDDCGLLQPAGTFGFLKQAITVCGDPQVPTSIQFNDFGDVDQLSALSPVAVGALTDIAGLYRSESTGTQVSISHFDEGWQLKAVGRFGAADFRLEQLAGSVWRARSIGAMPWGGVLAFEHDGDAFRFSNYRTRALVFRRSS
jgi:hypothetical protein